MSGISRWAPIELTVGHRADAATTRNGVRSDEELVRLAVEHPVGGCAPNTFIVDGLPKVT